MIGEKDFRGLENIYGDVLKLNLGCGSEKREGWINVDIRKDCNPDIVLDLNKKLPFKRNSIMKVYAKMILEHLDNPNEFLKELIRICENKAEIEIIVPHAFSYASHTDFTHKSFYTENSFDLEMLKTIGISELKLVNQEFLYFNKWKRFIPFKNFFKIWFNGIYDDLYFKLEVVK